LFGLTSEGNSVANVSHILPTDEATGIKGHAIRVGGGGAHNRTPAMTLHLHGLGHFHPENEITNDFLESLDIGTSGAWILDRVGIRTRRTVLSLDYIRETRNRDPRAALEASLHTNAAMGARAAEAAIRRAGIAKEDIGLVVAGSSAPDTVSPAEACNIACALGLEVPAFDVHSP